MSTRILFLYKNLLLNATLTASSEDSGFPASNLKNPFRTKVWRTDGTPAGTANLVIDLSATTRTVTGSNLVSNGEDFTGGPPPTGWVATDCTLAAAGGFLEITRTGGALQAAVQQNIAVTAHHMYKLVFNVKSGTSGNESFAGGIYTTVGGVINFTEGTSSGTSTQYTCYATPTVSAINVQVTKNTATAGTMLFDSIQLHDLTGGEINCVALTGYNWATAPGTLNLEFNNADSWGTPQATEALTWKAPTTTNGNKGSIIKTFTSKNYDFIRLNVVYATGNWDLGIIHLGTYFQPVINIGKGFSHNIVDPSIRLSTIGGQAHFDTIEKYRALGFSQMVSTEAEFNNFQKVFNEAGITKPIFIAYYYDSPDETTLYGNFTQAMASKHKTLNVYDLGFNFEEAR